MTFRSIHVVLDFTNTGTVFAVFGLPMPISSIINSFVGTPVNDARREEIVICPLLVQFPRFGSRPFSLQQSTTIEIWLN